MMQIRAGENQKDGIRKEALRCAGLVLSVWLLAGCESGGDDSRFPNHLFTQQPLAPYASDSPYADVLEGCVKATSEQSSCKLQVLPFVIDDVAPNTVPSVDVIMDRVATSHPWMGMRFRQALEEMPDAILTLMQPVTAIVIASDIRPSSYFAGTGAIYLDPANLWLEQHEKDTIDRAPDYRQGFGDELNFAPLSRFVSGNERAWEHYDLDEPGTREIDDIVKPLAALLFHELAHANDFFPPAVIASLDREKRPLPLAESVEHVSVTAQLIDSASLRSQLLMDLASVRYRGEKATTVMIELAAEDVGAEFEPDGAAIDYAYTSGYEDVATLFEEVMMKYHFNLDRDVVYADLLSDQPTNDCNDYRLGWGYRHRIGAPQVMRRAEFVVQRLIGRNDVSDYFDAIPEPKQLALGGNWCEVSSLEGVSMVSVQSKVSAQTRIPPADFGLGYH